MALLGYVGILLAAAVTAVLAMHDVLNLAPVNGPTAAVRAGTPAAAPSLNAPAPEPAAPASQANPRTGHWGPRVAPADWNAQAAAAHAERAAARRKANLAADHQHNAPRRQRQLPDIMTRADDNAAGPVSAPLGYAPPRPDRFRVW
jgi:hypothetical protein